MNGAFRLLSLLILISPLGCAAGPNGKPWSLAPRRDSAADANRNAPREIPVETPERQPATSGTDDSVESSDKLDPHTELLLRQLGSASNDPSIQNFVRHRLSDAPAQDDALAPNRDSTSLEASPAQSPTPASPTTTQDSASASSNSTHSGAASPAAPPSATAASIAPASTTSSAPASHAAIHSTADSTAAPANLASVATNTAPMPAPTTTMNSPPKQDSAVVPAAATSDSASHQPEVETANLTTPPPPQQPVVPTTQPTEDSSSTTETATTANHATAPEPAVPTTDEDWLSQLEDAYQSLDRYMAAEGDSLEAAQRNHLEIRKRLLAVAAGKREEALTAIEPLSPELQQFWKEQTFALLTLTEPDELDLHANFRIGDRRRFAVGLDHLRQAEASLADEAALRVHRIALCDRVDGFGKYHEFPRASFQGNDRLVIYCEVDNFRSETRPGEPGEGQIYETELHGSVVILDKDRKEVNLTEYQPIVDRCRFRRRDFYLHFTYTIPRDLPAGRYFISVVLEDVKAKKTTSSAPVELEIR